MNFEILGEWSSGITINQHVTVPKSNAHFLGGGATPQIVTVRFVFHVERENLPFGTSLGKIQGALLFRVRYFF